MSLTARLLSRRSSSSPISPSMRSRADGFFAGRPGDERQAKLGAHHRRQWPRRWVFRIRRCITG
jgi:hypothetical protein